MLSDSKLRSYHRKPQEKQLTLTDRDGLYLRVSKNGKLSFFMRYRYKGKPDQLTIGNYPDLSLKEARDRNLHFRKILSEGKNPKIQKKLEIEKHTEAIQFVELVELWYEKEAAHTKKNHKQILAAIKNHLLPHIGELPAQELTTHHFFDAFDKVKRTSPYQVPILLAQVRQMYAFAIRRKILDENPLLGISAWKDFHIVSKPVERVLDDDELRLLMDYVDHLKVKLPRDALNIELAMLFGCRMGELMKARIEHFDFFNMTWTVPPENHKTGKKTKKPIIRPILSESKPIIEKLISMSNDGEHLITSPKSKKPLKNNYWMHWPDKMNRWLERNGREPLAEWTMHDLRRTMRTNISRFTAPHIAEIMLGHTLPKIWGTYDQYGYIDEQRESYQMWFATIQSIRKGEEKIVQLKAV